MAKREKQGEKDKKINNDGGEGWERDWISIILLGSIYYFNELNRKIKVEMLGVL